MDIEMLKKIVSILESTECVLREARQEIEGELRNIIHQKAVKDDI